uniref:Cyclic nucleotide-binding domain-containing protein n=1 Tax=Chromera velia CCMP2878 TaxID=1169474 RepID=A0A0G4IA73_9ALVE|eukprot:Cvel_12477.t1-p1 / transcript=Cvel_12477.t1 / gene=Cvel_12477 / organism=Chromera_velia_CCMP2878 / gene_product=hypothetical protein / transcript_product=hypothetical protein / location=Cvel_scaffold818:19279-27292(+) / protein_length=1107 / sequence_SO=supercontig / SO=protein_coding / is_pseudo=false
MSEIALIRYISKLPPQKRTPGQLDTLERFLTRSNSYLGQFAAKRLMCMSLEYEFYPAGAEIFTWGDVGDKFYIILRGSVSVQIPDPVIFKAYKEAREMQKQKRQKKLRKAQLELETAPARRLSFQPPSLPVPTQAAPSQTSSKSQDSKIETEPTRKEKEEQGETEEKNPEVKVEQALDDKPDEEAEKGGREAPPPIEVTEDLSDSSDSDAGDQEGGDGAHGATGGLQLPIGSPQPPPSTPGTSAADIRRRTRRLSADLHNVLFGDEQNMAGAGETTKSKRESTFFKGDTPMLTPEEKVKTQKELEAEAEKQRVLDTVPFVEVAMLSAGMSFGEMALTVADARAATIVTREESEFLTLNREQFEASRGTAGATDLQLLAFLRQVPCLAEVSEKSLMATIPYLKKRDATQEETICGEGKDSDRVILVASGFCKVVKKFDPASVFSDQRVAVSRALGLPPSKPSYSMTKSEYPSCVKTKKDLSKTTMGGSDKKTEGDEKDDSDDEKQAQNLMLQELAARWHPLAPLAHSSLGRTDTIDDFAGSALRMQRRFSQGMPLPKTMGMRNGPGIRYRGEQKTNVKLAGPKRNRRTSTVGSIVDLGGMETQLIQMGAAEEAKRAAQQAQTASVETQDEGEGLMKSEGPSLKRTETRPLLSIDLRHLSWKSRSLLWQTAGGVKLDFLLHTAKEVYTADRLERLGCPKFRDSRLDRNAIESGEMDSRERATIEALRLSIEPTAWVTDFERDYKAALRQTEVKGFREQFQKLMRTVAEAQKDHHKRNRRKEQLASAFFRERQAERASRKEKAGGAAGGGGEGGENTQLKETEIPIDLKRTVTDATEGKSTKGSVDGRETPAVRTGSLSGRRQSIGTAVGFPPPPPPPLQSPPTAGGKTSGSISRKGTEANLARQSSRMQVTSEGPQKTNTKPPKEVQMRHTMRVAELRKNDVFGVREAILNKPYRMSLLADPSCEVFALSRADFLRHIDRDVVKALCERSKQLGLGDAVGARDDAMDHWVDAYSEWYRYKLEVVRDIQERKRAQNPTAAANAMARSGTDNAGVTVKPAKGGKRSQPPSRSPSMRRSTSTASPGAVRRKDTAASTGGEVPKAKVSLYYDS